MGIAGEVLVYSPSVLKPQPFKWVLTLVPHRCARPPYFLPMTDAAGTTLYTERSQNTLPAGEQKTQRLRIFCTLKNRPVRPGHRIPSIPPKRSVSKGSAPWVRWIESSEERTPISSIAKWDGRVPNEDDRGSAATRRTRPTGLSE